ncbi:hypothetical protein BGX26_004419, partial [Mortierella sp. AD094]
LLTMAMPLESPNMSELFADIYAIRKDNRALIFDDDQIKMKAYQSDDDRQLFEIRTHPNNSITLENINEKLYLATTVDNQVKAGKTAQRWFVEHVRDSDYFLKARPDSDSYLLDFPDLKLGVKSDSRPWTLENL